MGTSVRTFVGFRGVVLEGLTTGKSILVIAFGGCSCGRTRGPLVEPPVVSNFASPALCVAH